MGRGNENKNGFPITGDEIWWRAVIEVAVFYLRRLAQPQPC